MKQAIALCFIALPLFSAAEQPSAWRAGGGINFVFIEPTSAYSRSEEDWQKAIHASLDYSHNQHLMARFMLYRFDATVNDDIRGWGSEVQLLAGFNLNGLGARIYSGPVVFRESRKDKTAIHDQHRTFSGTGWSTGIGYQWQRWSFDLSATLRDNSDYVDYYEEKNVSLEDDEVWTTITNATVSYQL
ncbi:hypothetical protein A3759_09220 [Thalassolituus sp. HI0120]|jgi:hypothetical protein|nr:hypothetical protein A3759_09220 [Thalassolituus sp. HI0120]